ncbi:MAG: DNA primase [Proteobacteria bacterium]|nr:DNA primase [Pseudomonadota bacterium]
MTMFQDNTAQLVKDAADIVEVINEHVPLQKRGGRYIGICPFHSEKTPSFSVNQDRGFFHCFGCKESGDVISFIMKYHSLSFVDALKELAQRYGIVIEDKELGPLEKARAEKRKQLFAANEVAADFYHDFLVNSPIAEPARAYLESRRIPLEIIKSFRLGYAPDSWDFLTKKLDVAKFNQETAVEAGLLVAKENGNYYDRFRKRILCPIFSMAGEVAGFGGRILGDGQPKYLNTAETPVFDKGSILFGLYQTKKALQESKRCVLVEGNFDLLSMVAAGVGHVAAPLGTAVTLQHIRLLKRYVPEVILLFDGDQAGMKAAMRSVPFFLTEQLEGKVAILPEGHDPDTFLRDEGKVAMEDLLSKAYSLPDFIFGRFVEEYGLGIEGKGKIIRELQPLIKAIGNDQLQRSVFIAHFSEKLGLDPKEVAGHYQAGTQEKALLPPVRPTGQVTSGHRRFLEFLIMYPEHLSQFLDAGVEDFFAGNMAQHIIEVMKELSVDNFQAEMLLGQLDEPLKTIIAEMLVSVPACLPEQAEQTALEMIDWLKRFNLQKKRERLVVRIKQVQHENNLALLMELIEKKKELDEALIN